MRASRFISALLALFLCGCAPAFAQFGIVSNLTVKGSLTPGYTEVATNGAIRWNPTLMVHQGYNGTNWVAIAGSGSGFPLTGPVSFGWQAATNVGSMVGSNAQFGVMGTDPLPYASLIFTASGYTHAYTPRAVTNRLQIAISQASSNLPTLYPGQLVYNDVGSGAGNTYIQLRTLYPTNYFPYTTNQFPYSGESGDSTNFWKLFVEAGSDGSTGPAGPQGGDGIGNMRYGRWSNGFGYDYNTNSIWVVTDGEQWYDLIKTTGSTNDSPSLNTNVWRVSLRRGQDGTLTVISNLVERGVWNAIDTYNTNHVVQYMGNDFWVSPTNEQPAVGVPPGIDSDYEGTNTLYWSVRVSRGVRGAQGIPGTQNNFYNEYNTYPTFFTNPVINSPSATNPLPVYFDTVNSTDRFVYAGYVPVGTNRITVVGSNLYVNGLLFAPDNGALRHMAVSNVVESTSNKFDATTGLLVINTNPPAVGSGNGNMIVTNEGTAGQIAYRSDVNSNTVYWGAAPSGGTSVLKNIASYTYVGGEASVTLSFDPLYNPVFVSLTGDYVGDGGTNVSSANGIYYGVRINGRTTAYRAAFLYDSYHDGYPATPIVDASITGYMRLQNVPSTNQAVNAYFGIGPLPSGSSWEFLSSPRGISCFGRGFSISLNLQEYASFFQVGSLSTNDYVNRNFITQMMFAAYAATSGVQYLARSNATIRVWGVTQ